MLSVQFILMGLLAEILMRTYHESQDKRIYIVESKLNTPGGFEPDRDSDYNRHNRKEQSV
jgi:hypothetical protein